MLLELLREGAASRKALDKIQSEILASQRILDETKNAALPPNEMRAKLLSEFNAKLEHHSPDHHFGEFGNPDPREALIPDALRWVDIAWLLGAEAVVDMMLAKIVVSGRPPAISHKDRVAKIEAMRAKIDELERAEEIETLRLENAGHAILRREDARPEILFAVWDEAA